MSVILAFSVASTPADPASADDWIPAAIESLRADTYELRQQAMERLWSAGEAAVPALEAATRDRNAEVRARAEFVLDYLRMGVGHDAPRSLLRDIERFRTGSAEERRHAVRSIETAGRPRVLLALLESETSVRLRHEWNQALERCLSRAIAAGELDEVAHTLRDAAEQPAWTRHYAAFFAQQERIGSELARLDALPPSSQAATIPRRTALLRAAGNLPEAIAVSGQSSPSWTMALQLEQNDWAAAGHLLAQTLDPPPAKAPRGADDDIEPAPGDTTSAEPDELDIEQVALAAACFRLAGQSARLEDYLSRLRAAGRETADRIARMDGDASAASDPRRRQQRQEWVARQWHVAKALLLLGEYDEALHLVRHEQAALAFELLCERHQYRQAFALAGVAYPHGFDESWFTQAAARPVSMSGVPSSEFAIAQVAIRHLMFLGQRDGLPRCFTVMVEAARGDRDTRRLRSLCETAIKIGWRPEARRVASLIIAKEDRPAILSTLHPTRTSAASWWWEVFRASEASTDSTRLLERIDRLLKAAPPTEGTPAIQAELEPYFRDGIRRAENLPAAKQLNAWHELAETCAWHGRREQARGFYERAGEKSAADAVKAGDFHAQDKQWAQAERWYTKATQLEPAQPLPLYLQGHARVQQGDAVNGTRLMQRATLMPLAHEESRQELAAGLKERGYRGAALDQFEVLLRTGESRSSRLVEAAKQVGNLVYARDELRAANCWQVMLLACLKPSWGFVENGGYVQIPFLVHKTRARGLVKAGRIDEARREWEFSRTASPGNIELAEELVPLLLDAGQPAAADLLLIQTTAGLRDLLQDFSRCPTVHNNLAWLLARCRRDLDSALQHAMRALELDPERPSYLDTLGEVYFQRRQLERAVDCAERCLRLDPGNAHFQAQLEKYRRGPLAAPAVPPP
ncbi:MAG: tetratricopeptide repeat protein [Pirellulaceae bacterium]